MSKRPPVARAGRAASPPKSADTIAARIKQARAVRGFSARELSRRAGLNPGHVAVLESRANGRIWPQTVTAIAKALGVDSAWLLFGKGNPPAPLPATRAKRATAKITGTTAHVAKRRSATTRAR